MPGDPGVGRGEIAVFAGGHAVRIAQQLSHRPGESLHARLPENLPRQRDRRLQLFDGR